MASGRVTVPYLRAFKRAGGARVFAVFLQDPRFARASMDLIWVPEHDRHRGPNVIATLTSPHPFSPRRLAAARAAPDARLAALPTPRCAVVLGGPSGAQHFTAADLTRMTEAARAIVGQGFSIMATPSRRTPPRASRRRARRARRRAGLRLGRTTGDNPYASILALADAVLVTGDSANMVGEATATGAPVYVFEPSGGEAGKLGQAIDALERLGAIRRFAGRIERFAYTPINSSASSPPRSPAASPAPAPRRRERRWSGRERIVAARTSAAGPAIMLVRPQLAVNIGMCARAMANFGLDDLRLVDAARGLAAHRRIPRRRLRRGGRRGASARRRARLREPSARRSPT